MKYIFLVFMVALGLSITGSTFAMEPQKNEPNIQLHQLDKLLSHQFMFEYSFHKFEQAITYQSATLVPSSDAAYSEETVEEEQMDASLFPYLFYALIIVGLLVVLSADDSRKAISKRKQS
ncbi:MAG: hypothetical protein ACI97K_000207 [Glaciecola sp.]|jgi:hypothetical protein